MAKVIVKIQHVSWRAGRPRFQPSPKLRAFGFKGEDLRHPDKGPWFTVDEASRWIDAKMVAVEAALRREPDGKSAITGTKLQTGKPVARRAPVYTVEDLFEDWFRNPRFAGKDLVDGKRKQKALSPATVADYRAKRNVLEKYDPELFRSAVAALDPPILFGLYEELWRDRGLAMARGILAVLSAAISWGMRRGKVKIPVNPALRLGMELPEPRIRAGEPEEMRALVAAADAIGRPEIGDSVVLGLWTGQRQTDRLALVDAGLVNRRRIFKQSKTGAIVAIHEAPELEARLAAMRRRRAAATTGKADARPARTAAALPFVIVDETAAAPFKPDWYRHVFADVRTAAVAGIWRDKEGKLRIGVDEADRGRNDIEWIAPAVPTLADFQERDLRDTAVTWLARAGCTVPEIAAITGHAHGSVTQILKHYLARHPELGDTAIAKMIAWYPAEKRA